MLVKMHVCKSLPRRRGFHFQMLKSMAIAFPTYQWQIRAHVFPNNRHVLHGKGITGQDLTAIHRPQGKTVQEKITWAKWVEYICIHTDMRIGGTEQCSHPFVDVEG